MRPEIKCTLQYGILAGVFFLLPALFYTPINLYFDLPEGLLAIAMAGLITVFVVFHAYFTSKRYRVLEEQLSKQYRMIFEKLPNSVWILSTDNGEILLANEMATRYYGGLGVDEATGGNFCLLFQDPGQVRLKGVTRPLTVRNLVMVDRFYEPRQVDLFMMPIEYENRPCTLALVVDHSNVHRSLEENVQLNNSLIAQNERLKNFSFLHSHHIRSHLANILGIIHLMGDQQSPSGDVLQMLKKSAKNLDKEVKKVNRILMENSGVSRFSEKSDNPAKVIIFVDDDKVQHMINKRVLMRINPHLDLVFFEDPYEALSWLERNVADILLLDINMPMMEGWDFLNLMKERGINMEVKMLTSSLDPRDIEKSQHFEMVSGFLVKPLRKEVIDEFL
ncbi:MAG: response regulator [Lunatimonas sp.]|uniref:response regulator n=1 Tax=Lunatimonas sp. TaxID=2060141 RepID=UPI00263A9A78|nr:response regulator [Lunatimonas sp.]MCC5937907.1 response regulator [Lunatimonas sp.]